MHEYLLLTIIINIFIFFLYYNTLLYILYVTGIEKSTSAEEFFSNNNGMALKMLWACTMWSTRTQIGC